MRRLRPDTSTVSRQPPVDIAEEQSKAHMAMLVGRLEQFNAIIKRCADRGNPLPPGGVFFFNRSTVWLSTVQEMIAEIAKRLDVPVTAVGVNANPGSSEFEISLYLPNDYARDKGMIKLHVDGNLRICKDRFVERMEHRMRCFGWDYPC